MLLDLKVIHRVKLAKPIRAGLKKQIQVQVMD
jgi:hypothetical protein